jgi:hypothetical protein
MNGLALISELNEILLDKVAYDTDIPKHRLLADSKFSEYWNEYCQTTEDDWTLSDVIEYALELGYSGEHFGEDLWED